MARGIGMRHSGSGNWLFHGGGGDCPSPRHSHLPSMPRPLQRSSSGRGSERAEGSISQSVGVTVRLRCVAWAPPPMHALPKQILPSMAACDVMRGRTSVALRGKTRLASPRPLPLPLPVTQSVSPRLLYAWPETGTTPTTTNTTTQSPTAVAAACKHVVTARKPRSDGMTDTEHMPAVLTQGGRRNDCVMPSPTNLPSHIEAPTCPGDEYVPCPIVVEAQPTTNDKRPRELGLRLPYRIHPQRRRRWGRCAGQGANYAATQTKAGQDGSRLDPRSHAPAAPLGGSRSSHHKPPH